MGLQYEENRKSVASSTVTDNSVDEMVVNNEIDFTISGSGTSDSGVSFGASIDSGNSETDQREAHDTANDGEAFVSYNGFKVIVGDVGNQAQEGIADVGYQGIGADDLLLYSDKGSYDVNVYYSISGISLGLSSGSDSDDMAVSVSGELSGVSFGISSTDIDGSRTVTEVALGYTMGAVSINAAMQNVDYDAAATTDIDAYGVSVTYTSGAMTVTASMTDNDVTGQESNYGVGVAYDLGGGLAIKGGYGQIGKTSTADSKAVADLGLTMSF